MNIEKTKQVYDRLADDISRFIYEKRIMWSLTQNDKYIADIIKSMMEKQKADEMMKHTERVSGKLAVRGLGNEFQTLLRYYPGLSFSIIVDQDPVKLAASVHTDGHPIVSPKEFYEKYSDYYTIIASSMYQEEIEQELKNHNIPEDHIFNFGALSQSTEQYFEEGIIRPIENEVFIDGGCYDGMTIRRFVKWCRGEYESIYSFEPDKRNYKLAVKRMKDDPLHNVTIINKGLWNDDTELYFDESGTQGSGIVDSNDGTVIQTTSIDNVLNGNRATFIKLDVEGAEYEALTGAENTIRKYHPRMAISIYHKPEDVFVLPELILSFSEDYRFYIRHYQMSRYETILYAL